MQEIVKSLSEHIVHLFCILYTFMSPPPSILGEGDYVRLMKKGHSRAYFCRMTNCACFTTVKISHQL